MRPGSAHPRWRAAAPIVLLIALLPSLRVAPNDTLACGSLARQRPRGVPAICPLTTLRAATGLSVESTLFPKIPTEGKLDFLEERSRICFRMGRATSAGTGNTKAEWTSPHFGGGI